MTLIIGGKQHHCKTPVVDWSESKLEFRNGHGARPRVQTIDTIVLHWTAGENGADMVYRVLRARNLGIEFIIDQDGKIFQCCDPTELDTLDAGRVNKRSIGVEIVNYGHRRHTDLIPKRGRKRARVRTRINGVNYTVANFFPAQDSSVINLVDAIIEAIPTIPRSVPNIDGTLITETLPRSVLLGPKPLGVIGHFHASKKKIDPGTELLRTLLYHFRATEGEQS